MSKVIINVTQEHIDQGLPTSPWYCPIALATKRAIKNTDPNLSSVAVVGSKKIYLHYYNGKSIIAFTASNLIEFIRDFDNGRPVKPFDFEIDFETRICYKLS